MTSLHSRVKSSKTQAVKTGRGRQPPVSLLTEQVVNSAGWRDGQVQPPAQQAQTHRAGFRGFNPKVSGGNSLQKSVSSSAAARRPKPKARRPLDDPLRRALIPPYPAPPGAALLASGRGPGGRKEGRPHPRAASSGWWRRRAPAISRPRPSGPAGAQPVVGSRPRPHSPRRTGQDGPGPRRARAPLGAPAPQPQPNGFRGAC